MILSGIAVILLLQSAPLPELASVEPQVAKKIQTLEQEVAKHPQSPHAWGKLAMNLHAHDFQQESVPCYQKAASLDPRDFRWTYYAAIALQEIGSPDAISQFEKSVKQKPDYAPLHLRYAQSLLAVGRMEDASTEFEQVLKLDEKSAESHLGLARIAFASRNFEVSTSNLLKSIELNPDLGEAHGLLSEVYRIQNRPLEAERELIRSQQMPKKVPPADPELKDFLMEGVSSYWYELRGRGLLQKGDYEGAIQQLQQAAKASPEPRFYDTMGIAYQYQKKYREAVEQHRAALSLDPESAGTMNNLAAALAESDKVPEAISYLQKAIEVEPDFAYSYIHLAGIEWRNGNRTAALLALRRGHLSLPEDSQLALRLAWFLATVREEDLRNGSEAVKLASAECAKKGYQDAESLDILAAAYACAGDFDRAVQNAKRAEQLVNTGDLRKRIQLHLNLYLKRQAFYE